MGFHYLYHLARAQKIAVLLKTVPAKGFFIGYRILCLERNAK